MNTFNEPICGELHHVEEFENYLMNAVIGMTQDKFLDAKKLNTARELFSLAELMAVSICGDQPLDRREDRGAVSFTTHGIPLIDFYPIVFTVTYLDLSVKIETDIKYKVWMHHGLYHQFIEDYRKLIGI